MTQEELILSIKENKEKQQEEYMQKILSDVEWLAEKSNKKDYEPTLKEQQMFSRIVALIIDMQKWF